MIQELLSVGERKISIYSEGCAQTSLPHCPSSSPSLNPSLLSSSSAATFTSTTSTVSSNAETQNLRCPRCNSTNTKFCYYNNYSLTQPRHICKTCRRYWTKGGALRNVPIGGGCRKNKTRSSISTSAAKSLPSVKLKTNLSVSDIARQGFLGNGFVDHELPSSSNRAFLWSAPQNSPTLPLHGAAQDPNPFPLSCILPLKDDQLSFGSLISSELGNVASALSSKSLGMNSYISSQVPSTGPPSWRNSQQQNGFVPRGEVQELFQFQRFTPSTGSYYGDDELSALSDNIVPSSSGTTLNIMELAQVTVGDFSRFISPLSWSDVAAHP